ncbi:MAG: protein kinase [Candidatus Brocadiae bacterium]|nr:protein kinase [Candidatus Brocadiia bacterium]
MQKMNWQGESILENKYKIKRILKEGTLGISYQIEHFEWDIPLRLKCFFPAYFEEAKKFQNLKHSIDRWIGCKGYANIADAYYWETIEGELCLLTEYIPGTPLNEISFQEHSLEDLLHIAISVVYALQNAHQNRLYHGNLKAENIIVSNKDKVFINDFSGNTLLKEAKELFIEDIRQYGEILYFIFLGKKYQDISQEEFRKFPKNLSFGIEETICSCLYYPNEMDFFSLQQTLKSLYEKSAEGFYTKNNIFPTRLDVENFHKQAFAYMETGKELYAESLWTMAIENTPPSINALWNWHLYHLRKGSVSHDMFVEAIEEQNQMDEEEFLCARAEMALETGAKIFLCLENIQEYCEGKKVSPKLLRIQGELFYRTREFEKAIECFQLLLESQEAQSDDWYRLAICYFALQNFPKVQEVCEAGLKRNQESILLQLVQAVFSYNQEGEEKAQKLFLEILNKHPKTFWILIHVAEFHAGFGWYSRPTSPEKKKKAQQLYELLLQINPSCIRALRGYDLCNGKILPQKERYQIQIQEWSQTKKFTGHPYIITALAITNDNKTAVSGDSEGNIFVWDLLSGVHTNTLRGHRKHITSLCISTDGTKIASGSWDQSIRIWDTFSGKCIWQITEHKDSVSCMDMTQDGAYLISGSWDGSAQIWNIAEQKNIARLRTEGLWVTDVSIFPDAEMAIICNEYEEMSLWDIKSQKILAKMKGLTVVVSQDYTFAVSSRYNSIDLWQLPEGKFLNNIPIEGKEICLGISADKLLLMTRNEDDIITLWDLWHKRRLCTLQSEEFVCAALAQDGNSLLAGNEKDVYLWENITQREFPLFRHAHYLGHALHKPFKSPDMVEHTLRKAEIALYQEQYKEAFTLNSIIGKIPGYESANAVISGIDSCAKALNFKRKGVSVKLLLQRNLKADLTACAIALNGEIALLGTDDDPISQWNLHSGYTSHHWNGHYRCISALSIVPSGNLAISGSWDGSAIFWNLDSPEQHEIVEVSDTWITCVSISKDARWGILGTRDGQILLWDLFALKIKPLQEKSGQRIKHVTVKSSGYALGVLENGITKIWDLQSSEPKLLSTHRPHGRGITAIEMSEDGQTILSSSRDGIILFWKSNSLETLADFPHKGEVVCNLKLLENNSFVSVANNGSLKFWSFDEKEAIAHHYLHSVKITRAAINDNARFMLSGDETGEIKFWELLWDWQSVEQTTSRLELE